MIKAYVARNHNGRLIAWDQDLGNLAEEAMIYEEVTGNSISFAQEEFEQTPAELSNIR